MSHSPKSINNYKKMVYNQRNRAMSLEKEIQFKQQQQINYLQGVQNYKYNKVVLQHN